jgi:hypothetical protein
MYWDLSSEGEERILSFFECLVGLEVNEKSASIVSMASETLNHSFSVVEITVWKSFFIF